MLLTPYRSPTNRSENKMNITTFMKADWNGYSADVEPIPDNYNLFVESIRLAFRRRIPRGCRTEYVLCLIDKSNKLHEAYKRKYSSSPFDDGTIESGNTLIDKLPEEKGRDA